MVFLTIGGAVKVVLTFVFAAFLNGGVAGVAWASILSWAVSALLAVYALFFHDSVIRIPFKSIRFYKTELLAILKLGVPAGLIATNALPCDSPAVVTFIFYLPFSWRCANVNSPPA